MKQWLQYRSAIKLLLQQYVVEKLKRWVEKGKKKSEGCWCWSSESEQCLYGLVRVSAISGLQPQKDFLWSLSLLLVIFAILNFFYHFLKKNSLHKNEFSLLFSWRNMPTFPPHFPLLFRLMFLLPLGFFCQYFVVWLFKHHICAYCIIKKACVVVLNSLWLFFQTMIIFQKHISKYFFLFSFFLAPS